VQGENRRVENEDGGLARHADERPRLQGKSSAEHVTKREADVITLWLNGESATLKKSRCLT
jgi:hypothetical protein